jgi:hypothetical protein
LRAQESRLAPVRAASRGGLGESSPGGEGLPGPHETTPPSQATVAGAGQRDDLVVLELVPGAVRVDLARHLESASSPASLEQPIAFDLPLDDVGPPIEVDLMNAITGFGPEVDDDGNPEERLPSSSSVRFSGRLRSCASVWGGLGADGEVMDIVMSGYKIPFAVDRRDVPRFAASRNSSGCDEHKAWLLPHVALLEEVGAIRVVHEPPHIVASVNVVPKTTPGKFRLIVDLRCLNEYVLRRHFKYETLSSFRDRIEEGDFFVSIDLESAYYHVDVAEADQTFLGFRIDGVYYVFSVLPFGLRDACFIFTKIMSVPVRHLRKQGLRVLPYLDDFLFALRRACPDTANMIVNLLQSLGFIINFDKSVLIPTQLIDSLGHSVDSVDMLFRLTGRRIVKFDAAAVAVLAALEDGFAPARLVARVTGHIAAAALVFGREGRLYSHFLMDSIVDVARDADVLGRAAWSRRVFVGVAALDELRLWRNRLKHDASSSIRRRFRGSAQVLLASDASDLAWGGRVLSVEESWGATLLRITASARGAFLSHECTYSSTWRELRGAVRVLASFAPRLAGRLVDLQVDSQCAQLIFSKGGSLRRGPDGSLYLHKEILAIEQIANCHGIDLRLVWVPREENQLADDDSKMIDTSNYSLSREQFDSLDRRFGPHTVDRFADDQNKHVSSFNSRWFCPGTSAVDALAEPWSGENNWLHPPTALISIVIAKLRDERGHGTLIAPRQVWRQWWPSLFPAHGEPSPVVGTVELSRRKYSFTAHEAAASVGHYGEPPPWPMIAIRLDYYGYHHRRRTV